MTIQWSRRAARQLTAAHAYVGDDNPAAADRLMDGILYAVSHLANHPHAGREGRVKNTRELVIPGTPYVVAYRVRNDNAVQVLAVIHGKRRWPETC